MSTSSNNSIFSPFTGLLLALAILFQYLLPWWSMALASAIAAFLLASSAGGAFRIGAFINILVWLALAFWSHWRSEGILTTKIAGVLPLGGSAVALFVVTLVVGGLIGGLGALSGFQIRQLIKK
ncbi:hypothetical protein [Flectobacillus sp. BAB-3569]|jgi:hypothetical protein|uniref:hypothetical protein n=1 Tax=Flectobacillus sp. BAB-3569 TaxID=1509483 RepID=UPI000BA48001|nr:hypothetical protein [Flectobacillus sp. BAB-3569]NBA77458.1 hypothetical protein [Emticicia sp. ODNR4P]PAC32522.1 hypothetical protein BWI92_04775 [Flectobacillus sp. BAB-3569]